jgi:mutator protein MutT
MKSRKTIVVVLGMIFNHEGKVLITKRSDPNITKAHMQWDFPGGKNEFGETLEKTLKREILEETGLEVKAQYMFPLSVTKKWEHKDYIQHTLVFCYKCKFIKGKLHTEDPKITEMKWENLNKFSSYEFLSTTNRFINFFKKSYTV